MRTKNKKQSRKVQSNVEPVSQQPELTPLSIAEVRRLPKPHTGFEQFVNPLANLAQVYATQIGTDGIDVDEMKSTFAQYQALEDARATAAAQLALIDDTRLLLSSKTWAQELAIYSHARAAARTNVAISRALKPFESFMKNGPRKKGTTPGSSSNGSSGAPTS